MKPVQFLDNINSHSKQLMLGCFKPSVHKYKKGETIITYGSAVPKMIAILRDGVAQLELINADGEVFLLEKYHSGEVFGELFSLPLENFLYVVTATKDCTVVYLDYNHVISPCEKHCGHHSQLISNLFMMTAQKSQELSLHIAILGQSSIRTKIMSYLQYIRSSEKASMGINTLMEMDDNSKDRPTKNYSSTQKHKISQEHFLRENKNKKNGAYPDVSDTSYDIVSNKGEINSSPLNMQSYSPFTIPISLSDLAKYLMVDRSSMMREIKSMKEDGLIESKNREFRILQ